MERLELRETGQAFLAGHAVVASNVWERGGEPAARSRRSVVDEAPARRAEGDEVAIGEERWRVEEIVEDRPPPGPRGAGWTDSRLTARGARDPAADAVAARPLLHIAAVAAWWRSSTGA